MFERIKALSVVKSEGVFRALISELRTGLTDYADAASAVLKGSGINIVSPPPDYFSLERNFFSAIFLYSYYRAGINPDRRAFYAAVNQCLRGMVTGCDNILDDEYKKTIETDLPENAWKFRSIIDIMASDRVLFVLLLKLAEKNEVSLGRVALACSETLRALAMSGAQEATEEGGIDLVLKPDDVLRSVHHYKTGLLFKAPWAVPSVMEAGLDNALSSLVRDSLYDIGMGCQLMDDMVDMERDLRTKKHNLMVSLAFHEGNPIEKEAIEAALAAGSPHGSGGLLSEFPETVVRGAQLSFEYLDRGLSGLLAPEHAYLRGACIDFLADRIGASKFMDVVR